MAKNLVGLFDDRGTAQSAVQDLISAGISRDRISVVSNDGTSSAEDGVTVGTGNLGSEGFASGLGSGALVGGAAGLLIGMGFTVLPIAGILLAGPIAGLIAGAATGAATGGVLGGLIGLGIPEEHAHAYAEGVRRGGTLVAVQAGDDESRIRDVLNRDGAIDIESRGEAYRSQGWTGYDPDAKPYTGAEIVAERNRYATPINNDWNDTAEAPAPSADATYDDTDYRTHFGSLNPGGNYESYAPAYLYGRQLANDPTYGGATDWAEDDVRAGWEAHHPNTWESMKDSVRYAYDRARGVQSPNDRATLR